MTDWETWCSTDDNSLPETSSITEYQRALTTAADINGKPMNIAPHFRKLVTEVGFEDVREDIYKVYLILAGLIMQ